MKNLLVCECRTFPRALTQTRRTFVPWKHNISLLHLNVGGAKNAKALCKALGIEFLLEPLDCTPFYHGYGSNCSYAKLVNGIWRLRVKAINGVEAKFPFYMVPGEGSITLWKRDPPQVDPSWTRKRNGHSTRCWRDSQRRACSSNIPCPNQGVRRERSSYFFLSSLPN